MQIIFEFPSAYGTFRDALNLPDDHGFSEEELTAMKQERLDNWVAHIEVASQAEEPAQEA
jgi:hypothetical protein